MQSASHDIAVSVGPAPEEIGDWQELEDRGLAEAIVSIRGSSGTSMRARRPYEAFIVTLSALVCQPQYE
jgi:hypothetical protein